MSVVCEKCGETRKRYLISGEIVRICICERKRLSSSEKKLLRIQRKAYLRRRSHMRESIIAKRETALRKEKRNRKLYAAFEEEYSKRMEKFLADQKNISRPFMSDVYRMLHKQGYGVSPSAIRQQHKKIVKMFNEQERGN